MSESGSEINPLDALAEEFVARHRRGEHPSLDEFIARRPDLADDIRDLFPGLMLMENVRPDRGDATGPYAGGDGSAPTRLGDYRVLREVGRGGMGVVYEAEQESLGRHVALKVLPAHSLLDPQRLRRFHREAKAAARLHHTNIVPVFGVGEAHGLHYYVMQFIQGLGLDAVLVELMRLRQVKSPLPAAPAGADPSRPAVRPGGGEGTGGGRRIGEASAADVALSLLTGNFTGVGGPAAPPEDDGSPIPVPSGPKSDGSSGVHLPGQSENSQLSETGRAFWQSVARIGVQAAEALAYAHGQGTLHRDVKPSNLLLDTQGTVWVTDFGLAKAADSEDLTQAGDIVGTIRYMAPERFQGHSDARSDVYGLGLTLYELLALRPAFEASDRNKLLHQVTHEEPPRPRTVNRDVPRDLETVVLKAIARDPAHRYASAAELAADLRRFLEDKPIRARRVGLAEQLWRWARRNPVVAGLTAAVLLLLLVGTAASAVAAYYFSRSAATEARARADADKANNDIVTRDQEIQRQTDQQNEESEHLNRAYAFEESSKLHATNRAYDKALADYSRAIEERPDIGRLWLERGRLYYEFYCWDEAAPDFERGFELQSPPEILLWGFRAELRQYVGDQEGYRRVCAAMMDRYGQATDWNTAMEQAEACTAGPAALDDYSRVIRLMEGVVGSSSGLDAQRLSVFKVLLLRLYYRAGRSEQAIRYYENDDTLQKTPNLNLATGYAILALAYHGVGQDDKAREQLKRLDAELDKDVTYFSVNPPQSSYAAYTGYYSPQLYLLRREAAQALGNAAPTEHPLHWLVRGRSSTDLGKVDQAEADLTRLLAQQPDNPTLLRERGRLLALQGRWDAAVADFDRLMKQHPDDASGWYERGRMYVQQKKWEQAAADFSRGLETADLAAPNSPAPTDLLENGEAFAALVALRPDDGRLWQARADTLVGEGRYADALDACGKAIKIRPDSPEHYYRRAKIYASQEHWDEAAADCARILDLASGSRREEHWASLTSENDTEPISDRVLDRVFKLRPDNGLLYATRARLHVARHEWNLALSDFNEALKRLPDRDNLRLERGAVYARVGRWKEAAGDYDRVEAVQQPLSYDCLVRDCLHVLNGDDGDYRKQCAALAERYGKTPDANTAYYLACRVALRPDSLADAVPLVHWGEAIVTAYANDDADGAFALQTLGLDHYRAGHFSEAERWCRESLKIYPDPAWSGRPLSWLVLALACHRMNQPAEARQWFDKATAWLDEVNVQRSKEEAEFIPPNMDVDDWLKY